MSEAEQKLIKIKEQNKARAKKYYDAHKEEIAQRRKEKRVSVNKIVQQVQPKEVKEAPKEVPKEVKEVPKETQKVKVIKVKDVQVQDLTSLPKVLAVAKALKPKAKKVPYKNDITQLFDILDIVDLKTAFNNSKVVIRKIEEATLKNDSSKIYAVNSKKSLYQCLLWLITNMELPTPEKEVEKYKEKHDLYKVKSNMEAEEKKKTEKVLDFDEYLEKIKDKFEAESKEYIIASLYKLSGFRDNLQLKIISKETDEVDTNYVVVPAGKKQLSIILNVFKTDKKYKRDIIPLTKELSILIRKYIGEHGLEEGEYLFGDKPLGRFISAFNEKLGLKITINKLRQMRVSYTFNNNDMTAEERVQLAKEMKHAPNTSERYLRKVVPKK